MRKVLFLMFLLLLMGLGAAGVKAQVRIGGNTAPSAAAVLDLNATDVANTGTGGLVLPRVDLKSSTMQLTNGVDNQTGTMVYNTTTTLGQIGVYYWNGNSWVLASLPATSRQDSASFLMSTGSAWTLSPPYVLERTDTITLPAQTPSGNITWIQVCNETGTTHKAIPRGHAVTFVIPTVAMGDFCVSIHGLTALRNIHSFGGAVYMTNYDEIIPAGMQITIRCYRPSA